MPSHAPPAVETANDRFKRGFGRWFWIGLTLATAAHAGLILAVPGFAIADVSRPDDDGPIVVLAEDVPPPEPPEPVAPPAAPVIGGPNVDPLQTIAPTDLGSHPPNLLPPPPTSGADDAAQARRLTPMTIRPRLENAAEVRRLLERLYPPILRDAGIGGTVHVWFHLDETGRVLETELHRSSGYAELDAAALRVANAMEYSPAWNRDQRVKVWVSIPITFEVQRD